MTLEAISLTEAIMVAFDKEWATAKGSSLPEAGKEDRRLMFAAVARGLLDYLKIHQNDLINTVSYEDQPNQTITRKVTEVDLNINV